MTAAIDCESLQFLADQAVQAAGATTKVAIIKLPEEPEGVYGIIKSDGTFDRVVATPKPPQHALHSIDQVVPFVETATEKLGGNCSIWYSATAVVVLLTHDGLQPDQRPRGTVKLTHSPEFAVLKTEAANETWRAPKEFISFVRTKLPDAIHESEDFLRLMRSLRTTYSESGHNRSAQGRESLGREVDEGLESELGEIPDIVRCNVRVFDDPSIMRTQPVRCVLEVNPRTIQFRIVPVVADMTTAINTELHGLGDLLKAALPNHPVYFGSP